MTAFREYHFSSDELSRNITCTDSSYLLLFPVTNVHWTYFICCLEIHDEYNVIKSQVLTCSKLATNGHIVWHMIHDQDATTAKRCLILLTLSFRRTYPPSSIPNWKILDVYHSQTPMQHLLFKGGKCGYHLYRCKSPSHLPPPSRLHPASIPPNYSLSRHFVSTFPPFHTNLPAFSIPSSYFPFIMINTIQYSA